MIPRALEAEILRLHHAEHWPIGTIAAQLRVHHSTVRRVLAQAGVEVTKSTVRASIVEPYLAFIVETLAKYPTLRASRLHTMVRERGYTGAPDHFRAIVARLRPRPAAEAYLRLRTLPGQQAQCDWAHFGELTIGRAERPLMAFVMVLSYSRHLFLRFYFGASMSYFIRGHVAAFAYFNSAPRVVLYDNLRSAVLERTGNAIRFNPTLLELAAHYRFEPRPVAVARGNEKGRAERAIRFARDAFFAAREFRDLDDLNAQALTWCEGAAAERPCP
ncbi:MAG: IS21 family transposase, partial [Candidatus Acidiferrales bacterium]